MDFSLTGEQRMVQESVRRFARDEILPHTKDWEHDESIPRRLFHTMGQLDYLGVPVPEEYGGAGLDYISEAIVFEEVGYADSSVRTTLSVQMSLVELTILKWGTAEQKQRYLPALCRGEILGCFGLTEPNAGSDAGNIATTAKRDGSDWLLSGQKVWISNGTVADVAIIFAQTVPGSKRRGMAAFVVEPAAPGYTTRRITGKLGLKASDAGEIFLDNVRVPDSARLGEVGQGFKIAMSALDNGRYGVAGGCVGAAQHALDASVRYAQQRIAFNKPIGSFQLVQEMLARMKINVDDEYIPERLWRDCRVASLYEVASEIQKLIIGRHLAGLSAFEQPSRVKWHGRPGVHAAKRPASARSCRAPRLALAG